MVLESWTVQDATYDGGGFGFYNYSQSDVRYAGFTVAPDAACGDNVVDAEAGEECDDGNNVDGDCCTFNCLVETMPGCVDTTTTTTTTTLLETTTTTLEPPTTTTLPVCPNLCGDPAPVFGLITAVDAGAILRASVSLWECPLCVCDVDNGGTVMASDALADLQFAVGLHVGLACPELLIVGSAR
ncbi:MAG: hypothetical protein HY899_01810 [Deltaproteobacteria bacterium]|nr:hypothetical protein [Deltaproteobacteria bacterium]